jgi:NADP-dependent 3-hydroxy acid dehydrogenase YdfG
MKGGGAYSASKHAALAFSHATFEDLRDQGVKVCAICPGFVNTDMPGDEGVDRALMIQPADIAYTVRYILEFPNTGCPTEITIRPQLNPYLN